MIMSYMWLINSVILCNSYFDNNFILLIIKALLTYYSRTINDLFTMPYISYHCFYMLDYKLSLRTILEIWQLEIF